MALDPNISLGVKGIELANPLAQYGQIAAIQNAQNQNALAQYQLGTAQRQESAQNALSEAYRKSLNPETGGIDSQALIRNLAASNAAHLIPDVQTKLLATEKERGLIKKTDVETAEKELKLRNDKLNFAYNSVGAATTPEIAIQKINEGLKNGLFDFNTASAEINQIKNLTSPEDFQKYRVQKIMGILNEKDKIAYMLPKVTRQEAGGNIVAIQDNPMMPGYGMPIAGMNIAKTATIADQLAREKFAWEKANPGFELKEAEDGSIVGVNKRTLQAFPVSMGGGAPAAAPMAQTGVPSARLPAATTVPAIPGMTSVLDQQVPATAPAAGTPLRGKGQNLTESQGAATAYGMRMKEANSILAPLEKAGVKNTGLISGTVGGVVGLVPLIGDKLEGATGSVFNSLPQILGGLSPEQQQVAQARINFITAVLRKESGASISPSEFITAEKNYFPKPGDSESTIAQKQKTRETAIKAMEVQAGPGAKYIQQHQPSVGGGITNATANDPLGLGIR